MTDVVLAIIPYLGPRAEAKRLKNERRLARRAAERAALVGQVRRLKLGAITHGLRTGKVSRFQGGVL